MNTATPFAELTQRLRTWDRRRRGRDSLIWGPRGLLIGLLAAVLLAAAARLRPLLDGRELLWATLALALLGVAAGLVGVLTRRRDLLAQAHFADRQFRLQERTSTAVEIQLNALVVPPTLAQQQLQDTLRASAQLDTRALLPLRLHRQDWLMITLALILLALSFYLPNPQHDLLRAQRAVAESIQAQEEALQALINEIQQNPALSPEQQEELTQPVESALQALQEGNLGQEEAVAVLSQAEADLRDLAASHDVSALRQRLQEAGAPLADNPAAQSLGQALQNGDLSGASAAANQLADQLPQMSAAEQAALAQDLREAAQALQTIDSELAQQLAEAAASLENGDVAAAQQALRQAAGTLQQRAQETAAAQQAAQAAAALAAGREAVAQADGQSGQSGQPQANGAQGQQTGDTGQTGPGNEGAGQDGSPIQGLGNEADTGTEDAGGPGGPGPGGGHVENVYVPPLAALSDENGVQVELPAECRTNPAACGALLHENATEFGDEQSLVPYSQVYGDYRDAAYEALDSDYIPLGMKEFVRDYFASLEP